jgi:dihydroorotase
MNPAYDLILANARVYDATQGLRGVHKDVAIAGGRIAALSDHLDPASAREVRDLDGALLSAGWVDIHVHGYGGLALRDVQALGVRAGVTACIDAGDFGTATFDDFVALRAESVADMYGYIHMHPAGIPYTGLARGNYDSIAVGKLIELIGASRHIVKGVKMSAFGDMPFHVLQVAKVITEAAGVPFYVHLGEVSHFPTNRSITRRAAAMLTPGDIMTHIYTNDFGRILDDDGRVFPEILDARERGVVFDIGHGIGNFAFEIAERALEQGVAPDIISSDHNTLCVDYPSDLGSTMSKFLLLGMSLEDVVAKVTAAPAGRLGLSDHGSLAPGASADITVFHVESGDFEFQGSKEPARRGTRRIVPDFVLKAGREYRCDIGEVLAERNFKMAFREPEQVSRAEFSAEEGALLATIFGSLGKAAGMKGDELHRHVHKAIDESGQGKAAGLKTVYRALFEPHSVGFTPQIGWLLGRFGPEKLGRYREVFQ